MNRSLIIMLFLANVSTARSDVLLQLTEPQRQALIECIVKGVSTHPQIETNCTMLLGMIAAAPVLTRSESAPDKPKEGSGP